MDPLRIVSLIASSTEIVCALGLQDQLVGRSHECDYPTDVQQLPSCTAPKFADGTSYQIDERIKAILQEGLSVYRVEAGALGELAPDVIITQTQCDVCAVSLADVEEAVCDMIGSKPRIVAMEPNALEDIFVDIRKVADALEVSARGEDLVARLRARMDQVAQPAGRLDDRPTVACIEWIEPLMAAGNWMPELVEMAGGHSVIGAAGEHAPWMSWEQLQELDPDVIIAMPCGFDIERTRREIPTLTTKPEWSNLRAVIAGRVYVADGNQYFNRPGPRVVEALEIMAEMLHPEYFEFGHQGTGWEMLGDGIDQRPTRRTV
jgi:iron complex transport system substrate-binding protein